MARYVAFLRGVSPMNASMPALKRCFESAGFTEVKTLLASGNVVFDTPIRSADAINRKIQDAMAKRLDRTFVTILRPVAVLEKMIAADPYASFKIPAQAKRVVTFLGRPPHSQPALPIERDGARILALQGNEIFSVYLPSPRGPVFMTLIEKTFGRDVTTRTWETVKKCAKA